MNKTEKTDENASATLDEGYALMSEADVERVIGKHRKTLLRWAALKRFPKPITMGGKSKAWIKSEIQEWIEKKKATRSA